MSTNSTVPGPRSKAATALRLGLVVLALAVTTAGGYWAATCPCEGIPGFALRGEVRAEPTDDWRFANDVPLCQIQINVGWLPHSVNLNCMATPAGDLFLSCSAGATKFWCPRVAADEPGRLRLNGVVYPVFLNRVTDPATLDAAWAARIAKLQNPAVQAVQPPGASTPATNASRPESWWTFQVRSRRTGTS